MINTFDTKGSCWILFRSLRVIHEKTNVDIAAIPHLEEEEDFRLGNWRKAMVFPGAVGRLLSLL